MSETQPLIDLLTKIIDRQKDEIDVRPASVAAEALLELDRTEGVPGPLNRLSSGLNLRQMCRGLLRRQYHPDRTLPGDDLFPETLQDRYPIADDDEGTYRLRDELTLADYEFNVSSLRRQPQSRLRHADALEAWWNGDSRT